MHAATRRTIAAILVAAAGSLALTAGAQAQISGSIGGDLAGRPGAPVSGECLPGGLPGGCGSWLVSGPSR